MEVALDIKTGFEPPAPMTSPLEACYVVGTTIKAMKLGMPERKDTLSEMRDQLDEDVGGNEPKDSQITRIYAILRDFIRNEDTTDQMVEYVAYGYESER